MQLRIVLHDAQRFVARLRDQLPVHLGARDAIAGQAALPDAEHVAFAAQPQILLRDPEAVGGFADHLQPRLRHFAQRLVIEQQAGRGLRAAADPAAQLMQLREAKALGVLDHHDGRGRHVDADLDHGGRDQQADLVGGELRHHAILVGALHLAVDEADLVAEALLQALETLGRIGEMIGAFGFGFLDQRTDPVDQLARRQRAADRIDHVLEPAVRHGAGIDRLAAGRLLAQFGDVHVAEIGQHQRARDRRGAEHQHVDGFALRGQRQPLAHAEAMLLVDDGERQRLEHDVVLDQRMGADQKIDLAGFELRQELAPLLALLAAGEDRDPHAGALGQRRDGLDVLARENFGRRHQRRLLAGLDDGGGREQRNHGLAGADIALQQPQHPHRLLQIVGDRGRGLSLRGGQRVGQRVDDLLAQMAVAGMAVAGGPAQLRAHQRQRQLPGEQFVEGEPRPERAVGQDVGQLDRLMHAR